jgi:hypothetical protein
LVAAEHIGRVADDRTLEHVTIGEGDERALDFDGFESATAAADYRQVDDRLEGEAILDQAPADGALRQIHLGGEPVELVAAKLGISRFSLNRRIDTFCAPWRAAA